MFPTNPMMSMPFMGMAGQQSTPEQTAKMQLLALQSQQLQLRQQKQWLEQYAKNIDAELTQIDEQIAKVNKGEALPFQVQMPAQIQQVQAQAQSFTVRARFDRLADRYSDRLADRYSDRFDPRVDPQNMVMGGLGDFGRPVL